MFDDLEDDDGGPVPFKLSGRLGRRLALVAGVLGAAGTALVVADPDSVWGLGLTAAGLVLGMFVAWNTPV